MPARSKLESILLVIAGAIFMATSLIVAVKLPRGRGNDEDGHATYVRYVADYGTLPDPTAVEFGLNREPHQPPLYYLGGALWLRGARALGESQEIPGGISRDFEDPDGYVFELVELRPAAP